LLFGGPIAYYFCKDVGNYGFLIYFSFLIIGSVFPDYDLLLVNKKMSKERIFKIHRQITHGYGTFALIALPFFYLFLFNNFTDIKYFCAYLGFLTGFFSHIFFDTIFGRGGVPQLFYATRMKDRIRLPIFQNDSIVDNIIIPILGLLSFSYILFLFYEDSFAILGMYAISFIILLIFSNSFKNSIPLFLGGIVFLFL
jgi:membrane-bound metal-dependent hydrolase YbcI (DUF457 family)